MKKQPQIVVAKFESKKDTEKVEKPDENDIPKLKKVTPQQSQRIRDVRTKYCMKQAEFSKFIEVSNHIVAKYENGTAVFDPKEWDKIMRGIDKLSKLPLPEK